MFAAAITALFGAEPYHLSTRALNPLAEKTTADVFLGSAADGTSKAECHGD